MARNLGSKPIFTEAGKNQYGEHGSRLSCAVLRASKLVTLDLPKIPTLRQKQAIGDALQADQDHIRRVIFTIFLLQSAQPQRIVGHRLAAVCPWGTGNFSGLLMHGRRGRAGSG